MEQFLDRLFKLGRGYHLGTYKGRTYGVTVERSADHRRAKLFAEELGGPDRVSFNLYLPAGKAPLLKPCEMPKVVDFVLRFDLASPSTAE